MSKVRRGSISRKRCACSSVLERKLALYTLAAAGAAAFTAPAAAQVIYTKTNIILTDGVALIDLNHDGVADFTLTNFEISSRYYSQVFREGWLNVRGAASESPAVLGQSARRGPVALPVPHGVPIGSDSPAGFLQDQSPLSMGYAFVNNDSHSVRGRFPNAGTKYLGLRFTINGQVHYGWARLNVTPATFYPLMTAIVSGYAYEATPNKSIPAGYRGFSDGVDPEGSLGALSLGAAARR